jgi:hypothetical protein
MESEEVSAAEDFWESHKSGRAASGLVNEVVPCVDVVLPEGGEALEDVMCGRIRLRV